MIELFFSVTDHRFCSIPLLNVSNMRIRSYKTSVIPECRVPAAISLRTNRVGLLALVEEKENEMNTSMPGKTTSVMHLAFSTEGLLPPNQ